MQVNYTCKIGKVNNCRTNVYYSFTSRCCNDRLQMWTDKMNNQKLSTLKWKSFCSAESEATSTHKDNLSLNVLWLTVPKNENNKKKPTNCTIFGKCCLLNDFDLICRYVLCRLHWKLGHQMFRRKKMFIHQKIAVLSLKVLLP